MKQECCQVCGEPLTLSHNSERIMITRQGLTLDVFASEINLKLTKYFFKLCKQELKRRSLDKR